ncbi:serine/threonine-protein kinase [Pseudolysinimonas sp.]|uniref:serine/threonine-protein kinase n=1 Tax=Pseudolysinimonas sp. TaxID=2680009 RepID=UPI003F8232B8
MTAVHERSGPAGATGFVAGRYRIVDRLGDGGMARVYRAHDETLGRDVALKVFRQELASADDLARQRAEVRLLARLAHPSLVTLFDAVADADGRGVLVMEYVPGSDLRTRLADGPLPAAAVAALGADVARALDYIHGRGIVHRDVAPGNILLPDADGSAAAAKLTDLGIARLVDDAKITATGSVIGTAGYMSPEQVQGVAVTPTTDVYALGLVLLECLTGRREFPGNAVEAAAARLARDPVVPETVPAAWRDLLTRMTARDPGARPSASSVAERLTALLAEDTGRGSEQLERTKVLPRADAATEVLAAPASRSAPPASAPPRAARSPRSRALRLPLVVALGVLAAIGVTALLLAVVGIPHPAPAQPDPVSSYPAVGGTLGDHLRQLEHDVAR